jgi:hypothetical protein
MFRPTFRRLVFALALGACLGAPLPSSAASWAGSGPSPLSRLWSWMTYGLMKEGFRIDPDGRCVAQPSAPKAGCRIDPNGSCITQPSAPTLDAGCRLDPDGLCVSGR